VELVDKFNHVLAHYPRAALGRSRQAPRGLTQGEPDNKLYKIFRQRIFELRYNPPGPKWNGVWVFKTK
jgi:hypothetical protein